MGRHNGGGRGREEERKNEREKGKGGRDSGYMYDMMIKLPYPNVSLPSPLPDKYFNSPTKNPFLQTRLSRRKYLDFYDRSW